MQMDPGMDTGPMLSQRSIPILANDTAGSLSDKLSRLGAQLLVETLPGYLDGSLAPVPQPGEGVTMAPLLEKSAGALAPQAEPAELLARKVRAYNPWPVASLPWKGGALRVLKAHTAASAADGGVAGLRTVQDGLPAIVTAQGILVLDEVQPAGKRPMGGREFLQGARDWEDASH